MALPALAALSDELKTLANSATAADIQQINQKLDRIITMSETAFASLNTAVESLAGEVTTLKTDVADLTGRIATKDDVLNASMQTLASVEAELAQLKLAAEQVPADTAALESQIAAITASVVDARTKIEGMDPPPAAPAPTPDPTPAPEPAPAPAAPPADPTPPPADPAPATPTPDPAAGTETPPAAPVAS